MRQRSTTGQSSKDGITIQRPITYTPQLEISDAEWRAEGLIPCFVGMRFLLICKRYYTNKDLILDRYGRNYHLPVGLGEHGHVGLVLAADYECQKVPSFTDSGVTFESHSLCFRSPTVFARAVFAASRAFGPSVVVASGDVHLGLFGLLVARRCRVPFVFDVYDNYETFASARIPGFKHLYRWVVSRADLVVCVSSALGRELRPLTERTVTVGNGVDPGSFYPRDRRECREKLGIGEQENVVVYIGGISDTRGVRELIESVGALRSEGRRLSLLIAGINDSSLSLDEPWVDYRGEVAHEKVPELLSAADVAVLPYLDEPWGRFTHPTKLAEYLASGTPVVATELAGYRELEGLSGVRWCRPGDVRQMAEAIGLQLDDPTPTELSPALTWDGFVDHLERHLVDLVE